MYMFNCTRDSQIIHNQYQYQAKNKAVTIRRFVTTITKILRLLLGLLNVQTGASLLCRPEIQGDGLLLFCSKDLEEEGEDVDNIQVDVESGKDILFWTQGVPLVPHEELGVKCQKHGKQYGSQGSVGGIQPRYILKGKDDCKHQSRDEHNHAEDKQHALV